MSVLKSLAIVTLFIPAVGEVIAPNLYAQTIIAKAATAKPKAAKPQKKAPVRRNTAPAPGTGGSGGEFSVPVPEEDNWYNEEGVQRAAQVSSPSTQQIGLLGTVNYFGSGAGLEYVYNYSPTLSFGGTFLHTSASLKDDASDGASEYIDAQSNIFRAFARYAAYPYLYAAAGLDYDRISGEYGFKGSAINGDRIKTDFSAGITAIDVFFGSEWKLPWWRTYVGVDWIGFSVPLGGTIEYDANEDLEVTSKALKGKTPNQRLDEETSAQLRIYYLNLKVGMTF
ncbi:MAG: hypothetical protein EOP07_06135 [Proteobacteria bacterium]|nr:MAG: hypothetical protein EOP07_06135 [Pseudomonadota bacterium]